MDAGRVAGLWPLRWTVRRTACKDDRLRVTYNRGIDNAETDGAPASLARLRFQTPGLALTASVPLRPDRGRESVIHGGKRVLQKMALLASAGALGTLARFAVSAAVQKQWPLPWPLGTLIVNALGCFMAGLAFAASERLWPLHPDARLIVLTGFLGAFTTYSALILETGQLLQHQGWRGALGYLGLQLALGALACGAAWALMKALT